MVSTNAGFKFDLFARGTEQKIIVFSQFKAAYFWGNNRFREIINDADKNYPTHFFLPKLSLGLAFLNVYRVSVDLYPHFGNSFIKENFQSTFTISINP